MAEQKDDHLITLYRDSFPEFARMVRKMGGSLQQAKDSFHDAFLVFLEKEKAGKLHLHSSPKAYLLGTARICWLRTNKAPIFPLPDGFEPAEPEEGNREEQEKSLLESLQKSGRKCLELLKAFYYDHCSLQDIATRFGFNGRRSATVQKYKCLQKVRQTIKTTEMYAQ